MPQKAMGTTISFQQNSQTVRIGALRSISEIKADSEAIDELLRLIEADNA